MFILTTPPLPLEAPRLSAPSLRYATLAQSESRPAKPNTFWIFGPLGLERQIAPKDTVGLYLNLAIRNDGDTAEIVPALALEYLRYSSEGARGLGYGVRALVGSGFAIGPSLFYVTRPASKGVAFRVGATFPFGSDYVSFIPEIGLGFRF